MMVDDYNLEGFVSITYEFRLFCESKYWVGFIQSSFFMGQMLGGFIFPILANKYGRKKILLFGSGLGAISIILCGFVSRL